MMCVIDASIISHVVSTNLLSSYIPPLFTAFFKFPVVLEVE